MHMLQTRCAALSLALLSAILHVVSSQQMGRMMNGLSMKRSHSHISQHSPELLALWIDGKQVERFIGFAQDIYLIKGGMVKPYLHEPYIMNKLPVMPHDMDFVQLTWKAEKQTFRYKFSELKSLDPDLLYNPLLSIPNSGDIPKHQSVFELTIACTRNRSGIAMLSIVLDIFNSNYEKLAGSPLEFQLKKKCEAADKSRNGCRYACKNGGRCGDLKRCECKSGFGGHKCEIEKVEWKRLSGRRGSLEQTIEHSNALEQNGSLCQCENGGTCMDRDRCKCPPDFNGDKCQIKTGQCSVPCKNGGYCTANSVCSCPAGYTGQFCQRAFCRKPCGVHGRCVDIDTCECYRGWRGKQCNKTAKVSTEDESNEGSVSPTRKRRRQSDAVKDETKKFKQRRAHSHERNEKKKTRKPRRNRNHKNQKNKTEWSREG